jgi:hypothetical protein
MARYSKPSVWAAIEWNSARRSGVLSETRMSGYEFGELQVGADCNQAD